MGRPGDDGDLGDGSLSESVEELCPVANDASILLGSSRQEARHIFKGDQRNVESVAEPDETSALDRSVDVQATSRMPEKIRQKCTSKYFERPLLFIDCWKI